MYQALCLDLGLDRSAKDISIIDETYKLATHESIINLQTLFEKTVGLGELAKMTESIERTIEMALQCQKNLQN
jgi:hypothetical protein